MKALKYLLDYEDDRPRRSRVIAGKEKDFDRNKYSTIFHHITTELNLDTPTKITVFANIEGLSRGRNLCVLNYKKLAFLSGCTEADLLQTLREFTSKSLIEEGVDYLKRSGWRLTDNVRLLVEPIRAELSRNRAKKHALSKA